LGRIEEKILRPKKPHRGFARMPADQVLLALRQGFSPTSESGALIRIEEKTNF
jgi:hypothetical protein